MKKLLTLAIALVASFAIASVAFAAPKEFEYFSVDLPADWTVQEAQGAVMMVAPDGQSSITVSVQPLAGQSLQDAANAFAAQHGGTASADGDGFVVEFENGYVYVEAADDHSVAIMITGDESVVEPVFDSIEF